MQDLFGSSLEPAEGWAQGQAEGVCDLPPRGHGGSAHRPQQTSCYTWRKHVGLWKSVFKHFCSLDRLASAVATPEENVSVHESVLNRFCSLDRLSPAVATPEENMLVHGSVFWNISVVLMDWLQQQHSSQHVLYVCPVCNCQLFQQVFTFLIWEITVC